MDPSSPAYVQSEYFIHPDFYDTYPHDSAVVSIDGLHSSDARLTFGGNLNTLQLSGSGVPYFQPPSYLQAIRSNPQPQYPHQAHYRAHHQHTHSSSDLDEHDSPMHSISPPLTNLSTSDLSLSGADGVNPASVAIPTSMLPPYQPANTAGSTGTSSPATAPSLTTSASTPAMTSSPSSGTTGSSGLVHRRALRASTTAASSTIAAAGGGATRTGRKRASTSASHSHDDDFGSDDEDDLGISAHHETSAVTGGSSVSKRREEVRRQRIESEQRRRDELRDGYRRLKDVLPVSNQKSSKVSLLDRATTHIRQLEMTQTHMIMKINELEAEIARLRNVNETLMLSAAEQRRASSGSAGSF